MKIDKLLEQLKQQEMLDEHELINLKKMHDLISKLDDDGCKKKLKKLLYCRLIQYIASFIEFTNLSSMLYLLFTDSDFFESTLPCALNILIIESINENLQRVLRKGNNLNYQSIRHAILIDTTRQLFSSNLLSIAKNAAVNAYSFLQSNLSFFYRKAFISNAVPDENSTAPIFPSDIFAGSAALRRERTGWHRR